MCLGLHGFCKAIPKLNGRSAHSTFRTPDEHPIPVDTQDCRELMAAHKHISPPDNANGFSSLVLLDLLWSKTCHWNLFVYAALATYEIPLHVLACDALCHSMFVSISFFHLELPQKLLPHIIRGLIHIHEVFHTRMNNTKRRLPCRSMNLPAHLVRIFHDVLGEIPTMCSSSALGQLTSLAIGNDNLPHLLRLTGLFIRRGVRLHPVHIKSEHSLNSFIGFVSRPEYGDRHPCDKPQCNRPVHF